MKGLLVCACLVLASVAHADAISDEQASCLKHSAGDSCGASGTCVTETCTRQHPGQPATSYDCLVCRPGHGGGAGSGGGSSTSLIIGIVVAVVLIGGGIAFAYSRRRKEPA